MLKVEPTAMEKHLMDMQIDRKVVVKQSQAANRRNIWSILPTTIIWN